VDDGIRRLVSALTDAGAILRLSRRILLSVMLPLASLKSSMGEPCICMKRGSWLGFRG
jgi:hypothetical protein